MLHAQQLIDRYQLQQHPEGGWYRETYRSKESIPHEALPGRFNGIRAFSTAIYFLLEQENFSAFHRIQSDECWHFYAGDPLLIYVIHENGDLDVIQLGNNFDQGKSFQCVVPAGCWFASKPAPGSAYSFIGCTVSPGFDFNDFEIADVVSLIELYPQHAKIIQQFCR